MARGDFARWLYRGRRPNRIARILNIASAAIASSGIASNYLATLEVTGRKSGQIFSLPAREFADAGGLMSYAADQADIYWRVAYYVDRILKGAKPADLPVEQPTKFELVINLKTTKQIGLTTPQSMLIERIK